MAEMIILRERVITIKAGDTFDQGLQGNVLRVTAGQVPLRVQDRDQQMDFTLLAGERAEFPGEFPGLILSHNSGVDQTFTIQVGKGVNVASALVSGTVSISGTPTVINGGGTLTSITNAVKTVDDGFAYGASYKSITLMAGNTPDTVFTAAANVNGAILHAAYFFSASANYPNTCMIAKASAPLTAIDGDVILGAGAIANTTQRELVGYLGKSIKIPAGKGLYFISSLNEVAGNRSALYTLL